MFALSSGYGKCGKANEHMKFQIRDDSLSVHIMGVVIAKEVYLCELQ